MWIRESNVGNIFLDISIKIIKVFFAIYMVGLILFTYDWIIWTSTWIHNKAKFAIVYSSINSKNYVILENELKKIDLAISLFNDWKIEKIIINILGDNLWESEQSNIKNYILNKWVSTEDVIFDFENITFQDVSNNAFNINKLNWNFPNVWVIWISEFYNINNVRRSLKRSGFSYVWVENSTHYRLKDIYNVIREYNFYLLNKFLLLIHWTQENKEEIWKIWNKVIEISSETIANQKNMIISMNNFHINTFKKSINTKTNLIFTYRSKQKQFKDDINWYNYSQVKNTIDDSILVASRMSEDLINISNAFPIIESWENTLSEKQSNNFFIYLKNSFFKKFIGIKEFILTILYISIDYIVGIWRSIWDFIDSNSQSY